MSLRALKGIRELRFLLCQQCGGSQALRYIFIKIGLISQIIMKQSDQAQQPSQYENWKVSHPMSLQLIAMELRKRSIY